MLGIHRDQLPAPLRGGGAHQLAGHHQGLLVRQRDPLAGPERGQGRGQAGEAHHRIDDDVGLGMGGRFEKTVRAFPAHQAGKTGLPFGNLTAQELGIGSRR